MNPILAIQKYLKNNHIDALYIPKHDQFFSEYNQDADELLSFLTGFKGSAGFALITQEKVFLWVDGRYTLQAQKEFIGKKEHIFLHPEISFEAITTQENIQTIALNDKKISIVQYQKWSKLYTLKFLDDVFFNQFWSTRPSKKYGDINQHNLVYAGISYHEKLKTIQQKISEPFFITQPDEICWLFNIRGNDVLYSPLIHVYAIIYPHKKSQIFVFEKLQYKQLKNIFHDDVDIMFVDDLLTTLSHLKIIKSDFHTTPAFFYIYHQDSFSHERSPILFEKSIKNNIEIKNAKTAHVKDAVAVMETLCWIDTHENQESLTELDVVDYLYQMRLKQKNFKGESFPTIAGSGGNGAIIHYRPHAKTNRFLKQSDYLLLVDSGGQYLEGTTDITRTIALNKHIPQHIKTDYTLVLKSYIALANTCFPIGTKGGQLDVLARQFLWKQGKNYAHGTGHGVGSFLNVHEGPQGISPRSDVVLNEGMIISNEPGYYVEHCYGIRLENLECIQKSPHENFLQFETLTLVPYDEHCIDWSLLNHDEKIWLNNYYQKIKENVYSFLSPKCQEWFHRKEKRLNDALNN